MSKDTFRFKQFSLEQRGAAFKVGTDGCLLGGWVDVSGAGRILDIGTGSGLIALMLAQRSGAVITGVEVDEESARQAVTNAAQSPWSDRVTIHHAGLQNFRSEVTFDLIVSNPPFFKASTLSGDQRKDGARHEERLSLDDLVVHATRLSTAKGRFALVLPADREREILSIASQHGWHLRRSARINPSPGKAVNRLLLEWGRQPIMDPITQEWSLYTEHPRYSDEATALLSPFYLKL